MYAMYMHMPACVVIHLDAISDHIYLEISESIVL